MKKKMYLITLPVFLMMNQTVSAQSAKVWVGKNMIESDSWKAKINIQCLDKYKDCGTIDFQSLNCTGSLTFLGQKYDRYVFSEKLEYGNCVKGCEIHIESDGASYKEFCGNKYTGGGRLYY